MQSSNLKGLFIETKKVEPKTQSEQLKGLLVKHRLRCLAITNGKLKVLIKDKIKYYDRKRKGDLSIKKF